MRHTRAVTMMLVVVVVMAASLGSAGAETDPAEARTTTTTAGGSTSTVGGGPTLEDLIKAEAASNGAGQVRAQGGPGETVVTTAAQGGRPTILGLGASFPQLELDQWRADLKRISDLNVNYQTVGSGAGRQRFIDRVGDFSVSDIEFLPAELPRVTRAFVYAPVSAGGLGFMYQLKDADGRPVTDLKLNPETVCKIFAGQITSWDSAEIAASTGHQLKKVPITAVHRSDAAGTSFVLSEYCISQAPGVWNRMIDDFNGRNPRTPKEKLPSETWPDTPGSRRADQSNGVADSVSAQDGEGRITAVETGFAKVRKTKAYPQGFPVASVRNASNTYAQPTEANVTRALRYARVRPNGTHELIFTGPGADVYYPSSYSYIIAQTTGYDPAKGFVLASYIYYAATKGQEKANALGYAALSPNLVSAAVDAAEKIPGAPPRPAAIPRYDPSLDNGSGGAAGSSVLGTGAGGAGPGGAGNAAAGLGGVDPSVSLAFGALGATGGEHGRMALAGFTMVLAGEGVRRRSRRRMKGSRAR